MLTQREHHNLDIITSEESESRFGAKGEKSPPKKQHNCTKWWFLLIGTHWGQIVAGCETVLPGDPWVCRLPAPPSIPYPGSVDWVSFRHLDPWAWRSGSKVDSLPKHKAQAHEWVWTTIAKGQGGVSVLRISTQKIWRVTAHLSHLHRALGFWLCICSVLVLFSLL